MGGMVGGRVVGVVGGWIGVRGDDTAARWWAHVEALANDGMEGRNTGSPGHKRAADYVAAQFKKSGLEPAGAGGYLHPLPFQAPPTGQPTAHPRLFRNGAPEPLRLGEAAHVNVRVNPPAVV